jgi:cytochrome c-type biogenesis protein
MEALFTSAPSLAAFLAGVLSFISPCVLPLIPGYLSFISGVSLDEMRGTTQAARAETVAVRRRMLFTSLFFVLGFSLVFVTLGASATAIGQLVMAKSTLLGKVAGVIIVIFGLHTMGLLKIGWLYQEKRFQQSQKPAGMIGAMLVGIAFAFGWTPCIGPILAAILAIAGAQETVGQGIRLLAIYSAGLAIPFLLTTLAIDRFFVAFARIRRHYHTIEVASGMLMVAIGVLIFTNNFTIIARYLQDYLPVY